jgi:hypothetical protein
MDLVVRSYQLAKLLPRDELNGSVRQIRAPFVFQLTSRRVTVETISAITATNLTTGT